MKKRRPMPERRIAAIKIEPPREGCPTPEKNGFPTRKDAKAYKRMRQGMPGYDRTLELYRCPCALFHWGHRHTATRAESRAASERKSEGLTRA